MINEKRLSELQEFNRTMHSETEWLNFFHGNTQEMLDTIELLLSVARAAKEYRQVAWVHGPEFNARLKLDAMLTAIGLNPKE